MTLRYSNIYPHDPVSIMKPDETKGAAPMHIFMASGRDKFTFASALCLWVFYHHWLWSSNRHLSKIHLNLHAYILESSEHGIIVKRSSNQQCKLPCAVENASVTDDTWMISDPLKDLIMHRMANAWTVPMVLFISKPPGTRVHFYTWEPVHFLHYLAAGNGILISHMDPRNICNRSNKPATIYSPIGQLLLPLGDFK